MKVVIDDCRFIFVSMGNSKMGKVMNFSLMPGLTCSAAACITCLSGGCYAKSICDRRKNVKASWMNNTIVLNELVVNRKMCEFQDAINDVIAKKKPDFFRIHVGGDFFCKEYLMAWRYIAKCNPSVKFFAFTKQWQFFKSVALPENLHVIASSWPGLGMPRWVKARFPIAWLVNHGDPVPVRKNTFVCQGDCTKCHWCFDLSKAKGDVAFMKHR